MIKCLPAMWETQIRSLGREDPLEKEMATHSSTQILGFIMNLETEIFTGGLLGCTYLNGIQITLSMLIFVS